nr:immunoglobulin heavy chain junction region [Macaca mulatta]MOW32536.1 immunoglobulin heavy chain junction region [Macaca mulatta]MOW32639.1 immunoglobulin heavy chain junction region [Macaca mulatta]MOW32794.1 immunoglobulin heavy chain junction region [Macaca mulatta]MOW32862.1 immunoglobulin heavy chain junction region [Macaca mulatta]
CAKGDTAAIYYGLDSW